MKEAEGELHKLQLLSDMQHQSNTVSSIDDDTQAPPVTTMESPSGTAQSGLVSTTASDTNAESDKPADSAMRAVGDAGTRSVSAAASEDVTMQKEADAAANTAQDDAPKMSTGTTSDLKGKKRSAKTDKVVDTANDVSGAKKAKVDEPKKPKANEPKKAKEETIAFADLAISRQEELRGEHSIVCSIGIKTDIPCRGS